MTEKLEANKIPNNFTNLSPFSILDNNSSYFVKLFVKEK